MYKVIIVLLSFCLITFSSCSTEKSPTEDTVTSEVSPSTTATETTELEAPTVGSAPMATEIAEGESKAAAIAENKKIDHPIRPGKHSFTLQWLGSDKPGSSDVKFLSENKYKVVGRHNGEGNDFATIDGVLTYEGDQVFQFDGELSSRVSFINGGETCVKKGPVHFRATGTRKYWRLKEKDNCEGGNVVDYFDIYF